MGLATGTPGCIVSAEIEVTGLRNPCLQLDRFRPRPIAATLDCDADGNLVRKAGIMGMVVTSGEIWPSDRIDVLPALKAHRPLLPV